MKKFLIFLILTQFAFSQDNEQLKLLDEGGKAFTEGNYLLSKEKYLKASELYPSSQNCWYNLAASELKLGENEIACEHFFKVYKLGDTSVLKIIKEYCPNFNIGTIFLLDNVEEKPKFIFEGKEYLLFENRKLNQIYLDILIKNMKSSKILSRKLKGKVLISFSINKLAIFTGKIINVQAEEDDVEIVKIEILSIFRNIVTYIPAKNEGKYVDIEDKFALPIDFRK